MDFYVYILFRLNGVPCYVGKGRGDRWLRHEKRKRHYNSHMRSIVSQAREAGVELPKIKFAENLTEEVAFYLEKLLIASIGRADLGTGPLANRTDGGDGEAGRVFSDEHRAKLVSAFKTRKLSEETKAKIGAALKGRRKTPEHVRNASEGFRKNKKPWSDERRARMAESNRLKPRRPKGHGTSEETRAKIRATLLARNRKAVVASIQEGVSQ